MRVIHYVRVSTDEQGRTGYSVREQLHTLKAYSEAQGDDVVEEIADEGYSGASPERPGLFRVMELAESGEVDIVRAVKRDRFFRSRLYRLLTERDLEEFGVKMEALNDTGHRIGDGVTDDFAEWEREEITRRTLSGKLQKAREGKIIAGRLPVYGFGYTPDRNYYEVDEAKMVAVRRIFSLIASGVSVTGTARQMDEEGFPPPQGTRWQRPTIREIIFDDSYLPHSHEEMAALVSPDVLACLDDRPHGVWYYNRREVVKTRKGKKVRKKPKSEWVAVPVPDAGVPRETVESARRAIENNEKFTSAGRREWELSRGIIRCGECGCALVALTSHYDYTKKDGTKVKYLRPYYRCATYRRLGREGCPMHRNLHAANTEEMVWKAVRSAVLSPVRLRKALKARRARSDTRRDGRRLEAILARLSELRGRREGLIDLALDGPLSKAELSERLVPLDAQIKGLEDEAKTLRREEEELRDAEEDEQTMLRRLEASLPSDLDALTSPERREFYRRLGLTVLANRDKSLTLRWFVDVELEVIRCQEEGMSTK